MCHLRTFLHHWMWILQKHVGRDRQSPASTAAVKRIALWCEWEMPRHSWGEKIMCGMEFLVTYWGWIVYSVTLGFVVRGYSRALFAWFWLGKKETWMRLQRIKKIYPYDLSYPMKSFIRSYDSRGWSAGPTNRHLPVWAVIWVSDTL